MSTFSIDIVDGNQDEVLRKFGALERRRPSIRCEFLKAGSEVKGATIFDLTDDNTPEANAKLKADYDAA